MNNEKKQSMRELALFSIGLKIAEFILKRADKSTERKESTEINCVITIVEVARILKKEKKTIQIGDIRDWSTNDVLNNFFSAYAWGAIFYHEDIPELQVDRNEKKIVFMVNTDKLSARIEEIKIKVARLKKRYFSFEPTDLLNALPKHK